MNWFLVVIAGQASLSQSVRLQMLQCERRRLLRVKMRIEVTPATIPAIAARIATSCTPNAYRGSTECARPAANMLSIGRKRELIVGLSHELVPRNGPSGIRIQQDALPADCGREL